MTNAKHILTSKTFWLHALTLTVAIAATCQGQDWIQENPTVMQVLVYVSAIAGLGLRFLTDSPVTLKVPKGPAAGLLLAATCLAGPAVGADDHPHNAITQVNSRRLARGLRPFACDEGLTCAAEDAAKYRADRLIEAHTRNDFQFLPKGVKADAAGCAAWYGDKWGSCCWEDNYRFAGAAWCRGRDGRRYMHIFVRR